MGERNPDLVHEIAKAAVRDLGSFRGASRFSTWVQGIAEKKIKAELRGRIRRRRVIDDRVRVDVAETEEDEHPRWKHARIEPDLESPITLDQFAKVLSAQEKRLLLGMLEGKDRNELAQELRIGSEAVDSRRRRLTNKLRKQFAGARRLKGTCGS
jgi:RNA polymerase sigma factor (sigma-70 family)